MDPLASKPVGQSSDFTPSTQSDSIATNAIVPMRKQPAMRKRRAVKCDPCKKGKRGPCTEDPEDPDGSCFECKEKNREHKCLLMVASGPSPKRRRVDTHDSSTTETIEKLMNDVSSLKSVIANLAEQLSNQSEGNLPTTNGGSTYDPASATFLNSRNEKDPAPVTTIPPPPATWDASLAEYIDLSQTSSELIPFGLISSFDSSQDPIFLNSGYGKVTAALLRYTSLQAAEPIADFLDVYFSSKLTLITGLRTGLIPTKSLPDINEAGHVEFLIIEWREGDDTDVVAIFKSVAPEYLCNALFHYAICPWQLRGNHSQSSSYTWYVSDLEHLRDLFVTAQHALRLLPSKESGRPNLMQRFFQDDVSPTCSPEELTRQIRLLFPHLVIMKQLGSKFEKVSQGLNGLSKEEEFYRRNGSKYTLLKGEVSL